MGNKHGVNNMVPLLFMDSGAYSAKTQGLEIGMSEYISFLLAEKQHLRPYAALDVIGDPVRTESNFYKMMAHRLQPLPTFHTRENTEYLKRYVKHYKYIALGGGVGLSTAERITWLDMLWEKFLTDENGWPVVRVHGFGITSPELMQRYPWFSVDSTSWLMAASMGKCVCFHRGKLLVINVSDTSPDRDSRDAHIDSMTPGNREKAIKILELNGWRLEQVQGNYENRFYCNAMSYSMFAQTCGWRQFRAPQLGLFPEVKECASVGKAAPWRGLRLYLAGSTGKLGINRNLIMAGHHRLLSYHYIKDRRAEYNEVKEAINEYRARRDAGSVGRSEGSSSTEGA